MFEDIIQAAKQGTLKDVETEEEAATTPVPETAATSAATTSGDILENAHVRISVIGVGGAGCNCVDRLARSGIKSARTLAINTDGKHLNMVQAHRKLLIGKNITRGLGAGGHMDIARKCAEADRGFLKEGIGENELVFITAGMGGGTGGGAAPVIAQIAKEQGAMVVAIVTYPFALERVRLKKAQQALQDLVQTCDTVVVIDNNRLASYVPNLPINKAFELADSIAARAVTGIADTIMFPSLINVDFADVKAVMQQGGLSMISLGEASGVDRVEAVVKDTLEHPLLDVDYEGAKGCMLHIEGGPDLTLGDAIKVGEKLTERFDTMANVKVGARVNAASADKIRVTAIVTGVRSSHILKREEAETGTATEEALQYL